MTPENQEHLEGSWLVGIMENALDRDPVNTVWWKQKGKYRGYINKRKIIG